MFPCAMIARNYWIDIIATTRGKPYMYEACFVKQIPYFCWDFFVRRRVTMRFLRVIPPPRNWVLMDDPLVGSTSGDDGTGIWRKLTSAMAAGLAGHGCSIEEWLSGPFRNYV
jgi:hypothetical protein